MFGQRKIIKKVSHVHFPDKNCERELEVIPFTILIREMNDDLLLPLPGGEADLPVDQTRLNIGSKEEEEERE